MNKVNSDMREQEATANKLNLTKYGQHYSKNMRNNKLYTRGDRQTRHTWKQITALIKVTMETNKAEDKEELNTGVNTETRGQKTLQHKNPSSETQDEFMIEPSPLGADSRRSTTSLGR